MKVTFCDACGDECELGSNVFTPLVHIVEFAEGRMSGYVDRDGIAVSGREERFDLCHGCYINVFTAAYRVLQQTREVVNGKFKDIEKEELT